ncbi:hypothetical protein JHK82_016212 [Glycine max]|nr:hypothetical protein JHK82_016212 [Glycine max]
MESLRKLDLSLSGLMGLILHELGNLSNLQHLNLGYNYALQIDNLNWISRLSSLEYHDLNGTMRFFSKYMLDPMRLYTLTKLLSNSTSSSSFAKSTSKSNLLSSIVKTHFPVNSVSLEFHPNVCLVKSHGSNEILLKVHVGSNGLYTLTKLLSNSTSSSSFAKSTSKSNLLSSIVKTHFPVNSTFVNTISTNTWHSRILSYA